MQRREFITFVGGAAAAWPLGAKAQPTKRVPRIGVLWHAANAEEEREYLAVLEKAFSDLGYTQGKNIELVHRFPAEQPERFSSMARELVDAKVDVIIAVTQRGAIEVRKATPSLPTVFVLVSDPVTDGLVQSLSHPGGNMTGTSLMGSDLTGKRLALLKEAIPGLHRLALLFDFNFTLSSPAITSFLKAADTIGLVVQPIQVLKPNDIEQAFSSLARDGFDAAFIVGSIMFNERSRVGASAIAHKIPTMAIIGEMVPYGLLMSYGQDFPDYFRKAAATVDKILKGANPADLPVEQPTRFKQVINLKAAKSLGVTIPSSLLVTADEVIE